MGLRAGIGPRFMDFSDRFSGYFRPRTRTVETAAQPSVRGLLQAETQNMERMEEGIPDADHPALPPRWSESAGSERAVLDPVAQDAHRWWGGHEDSALRMDERGIPKKGTPSVGGGRPGCGPLGQVENSPVGVFAALSRGTDVTVIDERLFWPDAWTTKAARGPAAGIPKAQQGFLRKTDWARARIAPARPPGMGLAWGGFDGF